MVSKNILFPVFWFLAIAVYGQPTWTSVSDGNWNNPSTWQTYGGATGTPPQTLADFHQVIITNGYTITMNDDIILEDHASLRILNGGVLKMGSSPDDAPTFTMKSTVNQFFIDDATYESMSPGSGGNMLLEAGIVDWREARVYISGNFTVKDAVNDFTNINVCVRVAQDILFEGVGSASSYAVMTDAFYVSALDGSGNLTVKDNSYISAENLRLNGTSTTTNVELLSSHINGEIYSINAGQKLIISGMSGSPSLGYWCAQEVESSLDYFTGPKIQDCSVAGEVCDGTLTGIYQNNDIFAGEISLYPNPANSTVNLAGIGDYDLIEIYSSNGKLEFRIPSGNNEKLELEVSSLNPGFYLLKLTGSKDAVVKKLIIE